jgi:pyruvate/2-oxoglutarate dehydrogenase complex dihydrolipoamide acyltransferase (E2) component
VSRAEADRAQAAADGHAARLDAAWRDRDTAASARTGSAVSATLPVRAPFSGRVAEVSVTPGQSVAAGTALARLVRTRPVWLSLALPPDEAGRLREAEGLFVRRPGAEPLEMPRSAVRVVSRSPSSTPGQPPRRRSGGGPRHGGAADRERRRAEVSPAGKAGRHDRSAEAVVDDNGVSVVYAGRPAARRS